MRATRHSSRQPQRRPQRALRPRVVLLAAAMALPGAVPALADGSSPSGASGAVVVVPEPAGGAAKSPDAVAESLDPAAVVATGSLASVKARGANEIARRQRTLSELGARVAGLAPDCGANAQVAAEIATASAGLNAVGTSLAATTDLAVARTLFGSVSIDYRVYLVVAPKAAALTRCVAQATRTKALLAEGVTLQARIDAARTAGVDVAALQVKKDAALAQLTSVQPMNALAPLLPLAPDHGNKAVQSANAAAVAAADRAFDANYEAQKAVNRQLDDVRRGVGAGQRDERRDDRRDAREAKKAEKELERQAKQAERDAKRAARSSGNGQGRGNEKD